MTAPEDLRYRIAGYRDRERWNMRLKLAGIMVIVLSAFGLVGAIDMRADEATAAATREATQRFAAARALERGLRACPPAGPGMTDVLLMVIHSRPDLGVTVSGCSRIAERSYLPRSQAGR
jgi:hypothetical protein